MFQEMEVGPPESTVNGVDKKPTFFDTVHIKPTLTGNPFHPPLPKYLIGRPKDDEMKISVADQKAFI